MQKERQCTVLFVIKKVIFNLFKDHNTMLPSKEYKIRYIA